MIENSNSNWKSIPILPLIAAASILFLLLLSVKRPYFFGEMNVLGLLVLVVAGLIASQYETHFWTILVGVFFWAGSSFEPISLGDAGLGGISRAGLLCPHVAPHRV